MSQPFSTSYGLCPDEICQSSYRNLIGIDEWVVDEYSRTNFPGSPPCAPRIPEKYFRSIHTVSADPSYCVECGTKLIVAAVIPSLGVCKKCEQEYAPPSLRQGFHANCGAPVEVLDELRAAYHKAIDLQSILTGIEQMRSHGWLL